MLASTESVTSAGATLRAFSAGEPGRPAVVLASACGMPVALCEPWMNRLAADHQVITWETRGLFGGPDTAAGFDALDTGVAAQIDDLTAVMDHYRVDSAHVMGLCGGAVIAVRAAERHPDRVTSLSLWHGDFSGTPGPMTGHQENLRALLAMAVQSRDDAGMINTALADTAQAGVPAAIADLVAYPYSSDELFYRYSVLTLATMTEDVTGALAAVTCPALVVTSEDDSTAHPDGSHRVATGLANAALRVQPHGDHISVFGCSPELERILTDFLGRTSSAHPS